MDIMPIYLIFLHSIPETAILVSLGLVLTGLKPDLARILLVAFITSLASYFIRTLPLPPGINVFIQLPHINSAAYLYMQAPGCICGDYFFIGSYISRHC